jgi:hypothetical protein
MSKNTTDLDDFDFGFSVIDEKDLAVTKQATDANAKLEKMHKMILPLLNNLQANPDKDYILWPDRVKKIDQFKAKLQKLMDS